MNQPACSRVTRERHGHVLMIGLDRVAKRNAFDLKLLNELSLAYGEFEADSEARVVYLTAGYSDALAATLRRTGVQLEPLGPPRQLPLFG